TKVGDRYVLENMKANGYKIGGEQSGHVIFSDFACTGDGQLTAIQLLAVMKRTGKRLSELASEMEVFPQVLINVRVSQMGKARYDTDEEIKKAVESAERELGDSGRVLVRVSGTEPLIRVMLEGKDEIKIRRLAEEIAQVVSERLI
ncbi:MAG: phosphoglucosamine mutase, partial [Clostridia bacterium]|nr:phosphoglucosamine mutase [Clostridia bacterium]